MSPPACLPINHDHMVVPFVNSDIMDALSLCEYSPANVERGRVEGRSFARFRQQAGSAQRHERCRPHQQARTALFAVSRTVLRGRKRRLLTGCRVSVGADNGTSRPLVLLPVMVFTRVWNGSVLVSTLLCRLCDLKLMCAWCVCSCRSTSESVRSRERGLTRGLFEESRRGSGSGLRRLE